MAKPKKMQKNGVLMKKSIEQKMISAEWLRLKRKNDLAEGTIPEVDVRQKIREIIKIFLRSVKVNL
jgi:hypothetical protein